MQATQLSLELKLPMADSIIRTAVPPPEVTVAAGAGSGGSITRESLCDLLGYAAPTQPAMIPRQS